MFKIFVTYRLCRCNDELTATSNFSNANSAIFQTQGLHFITNHLEEHTNYFFNHICFQTSLNVWKRLFDDKHIERTSIALYLFMRHELVFSGRNYSQNNTVLPFESDVELCVQIDWFKPKDFWFVYNTLVLRRCHNL